MPSAAPSTVFSTTLFVPHGPIIAGEQPREQFGYSVSLSADGSIMAVGSRYHDAAGIVDAGLVQVYQWNNVDAWVPRGQAILGRNRQDWSGFSVALSQDGRRLAVTEPGFDGPKGDREGNVRIFQWIDNLQVWGPLGQELGGESLASLSGISVVFSGDGKRLAVGSPYFNGEGLNLSGRVRIFEYNSTSLAWDTVGQALDGESTIDWFGWDVDLSFDGNRVCAGAPRNAEHGGYVRCLDYDGLQWNPVGNDIINEIGDIHIADRFGLSISLDGDRIAVGCPAKDGVDSNTGLVVMFELQNNQWAQLGQPLQGKEFNQQMGFSVQLEGEFLVVGSPGSNGSSGEVTFHRWTGSQWDSVANTLVGTEARQEFGHAVSSSNDATIIVAASPATISRNPVATGIVQVYTR